MNVWSGTLKSVTLRKLKGTDDNTFVVMTLINSAGNTVEFAFDEVPDVYNFWKSLGSAVEILETNNSVTVEVLS